MSQRNATEPSFEDEDAPLRYLQYVIEAALAICILIVTIAFMQNKDLEDQLEDREKAFKQSKAEAAKYSSLLAECLNGGTVVDHANNIAYFCNRPLELKL